MELLSYVTSMSAKGTIARSCGWDNSRFSPHQIPNTSRPSRPVNICERLDIERRRLREAKITYRVVRLSVPSQFSDLDLKSESSFESRCRRWEQRKFALLFGRQSLDFLLCRRKWACSVHAPRIYEEIFTD